MVMILRWGGGGGGGGDGTTFINPRRCYSKKFRTVIEMRNNNKKKTKKCVCVRSSGRGVPCAPHPRAEGDPPAVSQGKATTNQENTTLSGIHTHACMHTRTNVCFQCAMSCLHSLLPQGGSNCLQIQYKV